MIKKKYHGGQKLLFLPLFIILFVTYFNSSKVNANYLTNEVTTQDIIDVCNLLSCPYNSTSAESRANALNRLLKDKNANLANVVFYTDLTNLYAILQNGSAGGDNLPILAVYYSSNYITVRAHQGFIYSGDKIIAVTPATYITKYMLSPSGGTYTESGGNIRFTGTLTTTNSIVDCNTRLLATWGYNAVATWQDTNYHGFRNLRPYKELSNWVTIAPTSTPTPTPTQEQSNSVDLTYTNQLQEITIDTIQGVGQDVNRQGELIRQAIPRSGDIGKQIIMGNESYWGTSGDLTGEKQEEEIQDYAEELIQNSSGELAKMEVSKQMQQVEDSFLSFFNADNGEQFYDLKIEWKDIKIKETTIIEAGNINFSKMCREIEELGTIRNTLRIIFNFNVAILLIKQIYNLILATLGIDNPYLYEDPEQEHEDITFDENRGTMTRTIRQGNKKWRRTYN